jgi:ubiquinone/menaquinone biosynthesis C-methylase UbiE
VQTDFGRRSADYVAYRPGPPPSFYEHLAERRALVGADALDLGTGPGVAATELAVRGANVIGLDISPQQIAAAESVARARGVADRCRFVVASAENTGLPDASIDLVLALQCWHWFQRERALAEAQRVLRPGGLMVLASFDYLPHRSAIAAATEALILRHNPTWPMAGFRGIYPERLEELQDGGFTDVVQLAYDHAQSFTHEAWRGRIRTCNGVGSGALTDEQVDAFDRELAAWLSAEVAEPFVIPHRIWMVAGRAPGVTATTAARSAPSGSRP